MLEIFQKDDAVEAKSGLKPALPHPQYPMPKERVHENGYTRTGAGSTRDTRQNQVQAGSGLVSIRRKIIAYSTTRRSKPA
jgi:hypothetical protein